MQPVHFQKLLCLVEGEEVGSHAKQTEAFLLEYLQHKIIIDAANETIRFKTSMMAPAQAMAWGFIKQHVLAISWIKYKFEI